MKGLLTFFKTVPKGAACPRAKPVRHKVGEERAIILAILNCGPVSCQTWSGVQDDDDDDRFHGNWSSHVGLARCPGASSNAPSGLFRVGVKASSNG